MADETLPRWEGKAIAELKGPTPDQVWPFLADFCNVHKLLPPIDTCHRVEGIPGQPGLVRYCTSTRSTMTPPRRSSNGPTRDSS
ncbi:hypothetical protein NL676_033893 [Syzygium grande]|nr:hypothetical protein NL676_033893 [Syzygium grande]